MQNVNSITELYLKKKTHMHRSKVFLFAVKDSCYRLNLNLIEKSFIQLQ